MDFLYNLQQIRNPVLDAIFSFFTLFGEELLVIGVLCLTYWCINKKLAYKVCFTYFISGLMVQGLKVGCRIERPWVRDNRLTIVESARDTATGYSFPSGHTQGCTGLFSILSFHIKRAAGYVISFTIIALLIFSRMYLGCHSPADVFTSFGITLVVALAVNYAFDNLTSSRLTDILVFVAIELISMGLIVFSYYNVVNGKTTEVLTMDAFKSAGAGIGFGIGWFIEKRYIDYNPNNTSSIWLQLLKFIIGIGTALLLKSGPKIIFGDILVVNIIRYAVAVIWIVAGYPALIKKFTR